MFNLKNKKVLITTGGTREYIDPVRFITNKSSGKMGIALADTAYSLGAEVILLSTINIKKDYKIINVETSLEMYEEVHKHFNNCDFLIMTAAISDYVPIEKSLNKIKKNEEFLTLKLKKSIDILKSLIILKQKQIVVGFCAETENLLENAQKKLLEKKLNFIIANDVSRSDIAFDSENNEVYILTNKEKPLFLEKQSKTELSLKIWNYIIEKNPL